MPWLKDSDNGLVQFCLPFTCRRTAFLRCQFSVLLPWPSLQVAIKLGFIAPYCECCMLLTAIGKYVFHNVYHCVQHILTLWHQTSLSHTHTYTYTYTHTQNGQCDAQKSVCHITTYGLMQPLFEFWVFPYHYMHLTLSVPNLFLNFSTSYM
jgi:hypothetical protein